MDSIISVEAGKRFARREHFIDLVKGILILCVFFAHALGGWNYLEWDFMVPPDSLNFNLWMVLRTIINSTVPVFIFFAGFLTTGNKYGFGTKIPMGRCMRFLTRFVVWSVIYSLLEIFVYHNDITVKSVIFGTNGIQLYYLLVMLQLTVLTPLFFRAKDKKLVFVICFVINIANNLVHVVFYLLRKEEMRNDMILCSCFICFYMLGVYLRNVNPDLFSKVPPRLTVPVYIVSLMFYMTSSYSLLLFTRSPLCATSFVTVAAIGYALGSIILVMKIWWRAREVDFTKNPVTRFLCWIGTNSLDFFLVHWVFEEYIKVWFINHVPAKYMHLSNIPIIGLTILLSSLYVLAVIQIRKLIKSAKTKSAVA